MQRTHKPPRFRIGELARAAGLTVEGVRYYERRGLLEPPARSPAGYRLYDTEALARLTFIRQAKAVGLSLKEIRQILVLSRAGVRPCKEVRAFMRSKLAEVERTIRDLKALRQRLTETLGCWEDMPEPPTGRHICGLIERAAGLPGEAPGADGAATGDKGNHTGERRRSSDRWRSRKVKSTSARTPTVGARSK